MWDSAVSYPYLGPRTISISTHISNPLLNLSMPSANCYSNANYFLLSLIAVLLYVLIGYFMEQMRALETRGKARAAKETAKRTAAAGSGSSGGQIKGKKSTGGEEESSEPKQVITTTSTTNATTTPHPLPLPRLPIQHPLPLLYYSRLYHHYTYILLTYYCTPPTRLPRRLLLNGGHSDN